MQKLLVSDMRGKCAIVRDTSGFELKPGVTIEVLPRYPVDATKRMTKEEKFKSVVVYLSKVVDLLKGVDDGENLYSPTSRRILADFQKQDVRLGTEGEDTLHTDREKQTHQRERLKSMDGR